MYYVYILQSEVNGRHYIGYSQDVQQRLSHHNGGKVKATKYIRPLRLVYQEAYSNSTEARKRERYLKAQKSRKLLEELRAGAISSAG